MSKGRNREEAESIAMAQYVDDGLIFDAIDKIMEPTKMVTRVREGVEANPVVCEKCGKITISRIESPDGQVGCLNCLKSFLIGQAKPGVGSLP